MKSQVRHARQHCDLIIVWRVAVSLSEFLDRTHGPQRRLVVENAANGADGSLKRLLSNVVS